MGQSTTAGDVFREVKEDLLFYQNSGWVQFGYRFSLDYMVFLIALLAVGGNRLGVFAKLLILFGIADARAAS